jgi:hypothetical protein
MMTLSHHLKTGTAANWAGPAISGGTFDTVSTTFVVPTANCKPTDAVTSMVAWAGIDGDSATDQMVEQAGVDVACLQGQPMYVAWTEEAPNPQSPISPSTFMVSPGDNVHVMVSVQGSTVSFVMDDTTTGATFAGSSPTLAGTQQASAECIAEAPERVSGGFFALTDFGTVTFSQCDASLVAPSVASDCQLVTGQGCPSATHTVLLSIGPRPGDLAVRGLAKAKAGPGAAFSVTWRHE